MEGAIVDGVSLHALFVPGIAEAPVAVKPLRRSDSENHHRPWITRRQATRKALSNSTIVVRRGQGMAPDGVELE